MSAAFFIALDCEDPGFDTFVNGKNLSKDSEGLGRMASALGLRPLEDYVSYSPDEALEMMEDMGGDPEALAQAELPEEQWFTAEEGLDLVARLASHVRANPAGLRDAEGVLSDLREFEGVLAQAKAIGARWNLKLDF